MTEEGNVADELIWHEMRWRVAGNVTGEGAITPEKCDDCLPEWERVETEEKEERVSGDRREDSWEKMAAIVLLSKAERVIW